MCKFWQVTIFNLSLNIPRIFPKNSCFFPYIHTFLFLFICIPRNILAGAFSSWWDPDRASRVL